MTPLNEAFVINYFYEQAQKNKKEPLIKLGIGDDAAIYTIPENTELVTSIDTLVSGVHFFEDADPYAVGYKSLAVSLSDMAAMGAKPFSVLLALTLPEINEQWLIDFSQGFFSLANQYNVTLMGGNTTKGPLSISTVVNGVVTSGKALLRRGAKINDLIYVSGTLGDAGLALQLLKTSAPVSAALLKQFKFPEPRVELGLALQSLASSAIDISDGLYIDLQKILTASQVGATLFAKHIPLSLEMRKQVSEAQAWQYALTAGDDYELCFTLSPEQAKTLPKAIKDKIFCIGKIVAKPGLIILDPQGHEMKINYSGFDHFGNDE